MSFFIAKEKAEKLRENFENTKVGRTTQKAQERKKSI